MQPPSLSEFPHEGGVIRQVYNHRRGEAGTVASEQFSEACSVEPDEVNLDQLAMLPKELHERQKFGFSACIRSVKNVV